MGFEVKYVGPKDSKTVDGQTFPRLVPVEVPNANASRLLSDPLTFLPAAQEVPAATLAQRDALPFAMEREAQDRIEAYQAAVYAAKALPRGAIDENTGKPDAVMQKRLDSIDGAQGEIDYANAQLDQASILRQRIESEKSLAATDVEPKRRQKAEAV